MKGLFFLCMTAALVHVAVLFDGYLKIKASRHAQPLNSQDYIYMIVVFKTGNLDNIFDALEDPDKIMPPTENITIFAGTKLDVQRSKAQMIRKDFSSPAAATSTINAYVRDKSNGKLENFVNNIDEYTAAVIVNINNGLKVPSAGGIGWTKQLIGNFKMGYSKNPGVTVIELPYTPYLSVLLAIPDKDRTDDVGTSLIPTTIAALRQTMTVQRVNVEVPRATIWAGSYMSVDLIPMDDEELIRNRYGYKVSAEFP